MAKFTIICPHCEAANQASTSLFSKKKIKCGSCHKEFDVKSERMSSRPCPHCGTEYVYDQAKPLKTCPVCHTKLSDSFVTVDCPQCNCKMQVSYGASGEYVCPVCDHKIEHIDQMIAKADQVVNFGVNVIKYEGDNDTFVWKHPIEDFNFGTQLIVHESQEAYFFTGGKMQEPLGPGRHTLKTANIPFLRELEKLPFGNQTAFHAEVYFVNKTIQMSIPWGTPDRVRFIDPDTEAPIDIGASGEMNLQVVDGAKLLKKIVGTTGGIKWDRPDGKTDLKEFSHTLRSYFRPMISTVVRSNLAQVIKAEAIDILEIDERLDQLSAGLRDKLAEGFEEYGLSVPQLFVTAVALPDDRDENFRIIKKFHTEKLKMRNIEFEKKMALAEQEAKIVKEREALAFAEIEAQRRRIQAQADIDIEAERTRATGMADVAVEEARGMAEAKVMEAKHYDQKDVIGADVQKAYAEALGEIGKGGGVAGGGSNGMIGDMVGLGVGLAALGAVTDKVTPAMKNLTDMSAQADVPAAQAAPKAEGWNCSCGAKDITSKFCPECGSAKPEAWDCACGMKGITSKFCPECGSAKPVAWDCPHCGKKGNTSKFCPECGKSPEAPAAPGTWNCACGKTDIGGNFCPDCGSKKPE